MWLMYFLCKYAYGTLKPVGSHNKKGNRIEGIIMEAMMHFKV
jgi:hypothetical protein